jgi:hypothetical protein
MTVRCALAIAVTVAVAHADPAPDPVAQRAGEEANLESTDQRQGFVASVGIGPSLTVGGGTGNGGALQIRLGYVMLPTAVAVLELSGSAQGHRLNGEIHYNDYSVLLGGLQVWFAPMGYFRLGGGFGGYRCRQCKDPDDETNIMPVDYEHRGVAGGAAVGLDLARFLGIVVGVEVGGTLTIYKSGAIVGLGSNLVVSLD